MILFPDKSIYSVGLLSFLWATTFCGIAVAVLYEGKFKVGLMIASYVGMGWAVVICFGDLLQRIDSHGLNLLVGGGVLYTAGVPFNIKDGRTCGMPDHTIWHLFVMGGSALHYFCVMDSLVTFPYA